jgi:superfamily I DNA/RNA helicase
VEVDDLDGGKDSQQGYRSLMHGPDPEHMQCANPAEQAKAIQSFLEQHEIDFGACCVVARTNSEVSSIAVEFDVLGVSTSKIEGKSGHKEVLGVINLATMHRVKGLEFDYVFLASANEGLIPMEMVLRNAGDAITRKQKEEEERSLVYVTLTRARKQAFIYSYGNRSEFFTSSTTKE